MSLGFDAISALPFATSQLRIEMLSVATNKSLNNYDR